MTVLSISLLFSDWGISLFNLPDIILASRSVSHTDSGYIVRVRKHTHTQNLSHTLFPHLPMGYFLSTPTVPVTRHCCPNIPSPKAHSKADSMQDKAPWTRHRGIHKEAGTTPQRGTFPLETRPFTKKFSGEGTGSYVYRVLKSPVQWGKQLSLIWLGLIKFKFPQNLWKGYNQVRSLLLLNYTLVLKFFPSTKLKK